MSGTLRWRPILDEYVAKLPHPGHCYRVVVGIVGRMPTDTGAS